MVAHDTFLVLGEKFVVWMISFTEQTNIVLVYVKLVFVYNLKTLIVRNLVALSERHNLVVKKGSFYGI